MKLVKEHIHDSGIIAKARAMCARRTDQEISDYLGMELAQVERIRASLPKRVSELTRVLRERGVLK